MPMKVSGAKKKPVGKGKPARKKSAVRTKTAGKKVAAKSKAGKKKPVVKSKAVKKKVAVKRVAARHKTPKKVAVKTKVLVKKKRAATVRNRAPEESQILKTTAFSTSLTARHSSGQSGDLQGLSAIESADSESVEELLEEGNAFEAAVVMGVEDADNADLEEVRTHQVPEDDVPREYLDSD